MKILRYEDSLKNLSKEPKPIVFLAGPTVRGNQPHLTSWRFEAIEIFKELNFDGILVIPEFTERTESDKGKEWIPRWEYTGLLCSDINLFWIPRTKELIGLTTNCEFGYWLAKNQDKVVYGRPDDAYRISYLDNMWGMHATYNFDKIPPIYSTLKETIQASINEALKFYETKMFRLDSRISNIVIDSPYENNNNDDVLDHWDEVLGHDGDKESLGLDEEFGS